MNHRHPKYIVRESDGSEHYAYDTGQLNFVIRQLVQAGRGGVVYNIGKMVGAIDMPAGDENVAETS